MAVNSDSNKKKAVKAFNKGDSVESLALEYGVSTRTIYRWITKYQGGTGNGC